MLSHMRYACWLGLLVAVAASGCGPGSEDDDERPWEVAFDATDTGWLLNVWGPSDDELYTVGGTPDSGVVVGFDGETWTPVDLGIDVPLLTWAYGFGSNDITIVGFEGTVIHYDGTAWEIQETPTDEHLWGVWGASPDNLWAVGGRGREAGQATVLHYDGTEWSEAPVPELMRANVFAWFKVFGTSAGDVFAVGQRGAVMHFDGTEWTEEFVGASDDLISVWGTGPNNIVAVGGRGIAVVSRWDGAEWTTETYPSVPGLNGVWMRTPDTAHLVGGFGTALSFDVTTMTPTLEIAETNHDFHGVFGAGGDHVVAVGGNLLSPGPPFIGIAFDRELGGQE